MLARIAALERRSALVVADLPAGPAGRVDLARLVRERPPGELLVALQRARSGGELLWAGIAGLALSRTAQAGSAGAPTAAAGDLESASTEQRGLVSAVDLAPTILGHLGLHAPAAMDGRPIVARGRLDTAALGALDARLRAIPGRRLPALAVLLAACAALALACVVLDSGAGALSRRRRARAAALALRTAALAPLWAPCAALVTAALQPSAGAEYALIACLAIALAAATDLLLRWPRALAAPALAAPLAIAIDALARTQLQMRSLAGPDPVGGARFFGIGNELKSALAAMALLGVAAALYPSARRRDRVGRTAPARSAPPTRSCQPGRAADRRHAVAALAACGLVLLVVEGWARIGAGVGGAVLVSAAFALALALLMAPGGRRLLVLGAVPAGLALLVAIDLVAARGRGQLQGSVLEARSLADVRDELDNRYATAWRALREPGMALATVVAAVLAAAGARLRARLLAPVGGDELFAAAFAGGLLGGVVGALVEDSGPLLLVQAVLVLACAAVYLHAAAPRRGAAHGAPVYASSSAAPNAAAERPTIAVLGGSQGTA